MRKLAGLGLLPGFLIETAVVPFVLKDGVPEVVYHIERGFSIPPFGDLVTGIEVLRAATPDRPDEKISIDVSRAHLSLAIRNLLMALLDKRRLD